MASGLSRSRPSPVDVGWRIAAIAAVYAVLSLPVNLASAAQSHSPRVTAVLIGVVTGAAYALVMLPLARRLPYRGRTRFGVVFMLLYVVGVLSNLVEARFYTTMASSELISAAIIEAIPVAAASGMIVWLLRPHEPAGAAPRISEILARRPLRSWAWRIGALGLLYALVLDLSGKLWGPVIDRYYHDPAFMAQTGTITQPGYVSWPEETVRGIVFALVLLPVVAVMAGRDWRSLLAVGAYVALFNAAIEGWLPMLSLTNYPVQYRLGEGGGDLTTDAIVRGALVALLLALPATAAIRHRLSEAPAVPT